MKPTEKKLLLKDREKPVINPHAGNIELHIQLPLPIYPATAVCFQALSPVRVYQNPIS